MSDQAHFNDQTRETEKWATALAEATMPREPPAGRRPAG
jgi:hypothetical protein